MSDGGEVVSFGSARAKRNDSCRQWSVGDALAEALREERELESNGTPSRAVIVLVCRDNEAGGWDLDGVYGGPDSTRDRLYAMISQKATWMAVDNRKEP